MSLYNVERYLFLLKASASMQKELTENPSQHVEQQDLDEQQKAALINKDLAALWRMGVHPLLLTPLARLFGIAPGDYYAALRSMANQRRLKS